MNARWTIGFLLLAACALDPQDRGEIRQALIPVAWTDVVGASASGNDLTKTAPETAFNAGAVSVETLSGDGFVEFTSGEATTDKAIGLSVGNGGQALADIDFAIRLNASGLASVWEGGVNRGGIGPYAAGDLFRVQAEGVVVTYWRNGVVRYTSALAPSFPLLVDTSLRTPGATINDVVIESLQFWTDAVGVAVDGNDLSKTAPQTQWNAGATSIASIPSGDGYVEFRVADNTTLKAAGLSNGNGGESYTDIDFAIYLTASGGIAVYENGIKRGNFGTYAPGDVFRVQVSGGVVTYLDNYVTFYTSSTAPTFPLLLDSSLRTPGASLLDARLVAGALSEDCAPLEQSLLGAQPFENLGEVMNAAGNVLVVPTPFGGDTLKVYRQRPAGWELEQEIVPPGDVREADTDGTTIVALFQPEGVVHVYRHDGIQWIEDGVITSCSGNDFSSAAVSGDAILLTGGGVGASIYRRGEDGWLLDAVLPDGDISGFGNEAAIGGDRAFVAGYGNDLEGAIYVFRYNPALPTEPASCSTPGPGKWRQKAVLRPSNTGPGQFFASNSMDVNRSGTRVIAGNQSVHTAHIFDLDGGVWSETAVLSPYPSSEFFGRSVALGGPDALGGSVAVVGTSDSYAGNDELDDEAFVFTDMGGGVWQQIDRIVGPDTCCDEVAAADDAVFVADDSDDEGGQNAGAIRVHGIEAVCLGE